MVFSTVPVYLDPPNLQQQTDHHQQEASFNENNINHQFPHLHPTGSAAAHHVNNNATSGSIRPGSMAERARFAKIPQPEGPLKCPRCESTNTKFCYFNNYNLSQPRHFCKTCRRYWTRGGALRNVPVGGGCRRNKKSKSSSSRSSANSAERQTVGSTSGGIGIQSSEVLGHMQQASSLPFMPSFARFGPGNIGSNNLGLNLSGIHGQFEASNGGSGQGAGIEFGAAGSELGSSNLALSTGSMAQWRPQQFPLLAGFETPIGLYSSFESEGFGGPSSSNLIGYSQLRPMTSNSGITQLAPVKMEGNQVPNLPRPSLGIDENSQLWGANSWTNLRDPSSTSTSTSHLS